MKSKLLVTLTLATLIIAACKSKKSTTSTTPKKTTAPENTAVVKLEPILLAPALITKSSTGIFPPGNEELTAIQVNYKEVTMQTLVQGHKLYTGVCTGCHEAVSIYTLREENCKSIIDRMASKANINDAEKDAVYKYVLAIKATQPK